MINPFGKKKKKDDKDKRKAKAQAGEPKQKLHTIESLRSIAVQKSFQSQKNDLKLYSKILNRYCMKISANQVSI